jgi:hypothetical protein
LVKIPWVGKSGEKSGQFSNSAVFLFHFFHWERLRWHTHWWTECLIDFQCWKHWCGHLAQFWWNELHCEASNWPQKDVSSDPAVAPFEVNWKDLFQLIPHPKTSLNAFYHWKELANQHGGKLTISSLKFSYQFSDPFRKISLKLK